MTQTEDGARIILGNRTIDLGTDLIDWIINKPNPIVQLFYLAIAGGGFYIYVTVAMFKYIPSPMVSGYHVYSGTIVMFICYYSFYMASFTDPGNILDK